ncbi:MAG: DUF4230 domain-containing protein [Solobacterium sp.]|nr:DUF4230 domain-containing protein [Solobacterium sp.]
MRKLLWNLFKIAVIVVIAFGIYDNYFRTEPTHTISVEDHGSILPHTEAEISDVVLGESRKKQELVVYEQDLSASQTITTGILDLDIFRKTKEIKSYGTAIYVVDLSSLNEDDISYDASASLVTVHVPHAALKTVTLNAEKTEFSDVEHGLLTWGDIKLTPEQQNLLTQELQADSSILTKADLSAEESLKELYSTVLHTLDPDLSVRVTFR